MHDKGSSAGTSALESTAGQLPPDEVLRTFDKECEVAFQEERYLVRNNGAVFRCARPQARRRKHDEVWTFGTLDRHKGYLVVGGHVVHRIVATAYHGPKPSSDHVVDHIDTNRQSNRPENLRWVTRLENILLNPITRARIMIAFGSLEAFFENPGAHTIPNLEWMRVVTQEQAKQSRERLLAWAEKGQVGRGGTLGDWLYQSAIEFSEPAGEQTGGFSMDAAQRSAVDAVRFTTSGVSRNPAPRRRVPLVRSAEPEPVDWPSLTAVAFQRKWRTPTDFPQCPSSPSDESLDRYLAKLKPGAVFARNRYGESTVVAAAIGPRRILSVACRTETGVKGWTHATVYLEGAYFCHESGATYFERAGAMKAHCIAIGAPFDEYDGSIDDFC